MGLVKSGNGSEMDDITNYIFYNFYVNEQELC